jgi:hypothetical protein
MTPDVFDLIEQAVRSGGADAGLDLLIRTLAEDKNYQLLFEARMMRTRHELGLPLVQTGSIDDIPDEKRAAYEQAFAASAREVGSLLLADGDILRAWPYFRAIREPAPVADAIEKIDVGEGEEWDGVIQLALEERVNPRKGFELLLGRYGLCRAITFFEQYPDPKTREQCLGLLVRTLHRELVENLSQAIARREGQMPETRNVLELVAGRDWLFGDMDYYVDTSHLIAVIRFALDLHDPEGLRLGLQLCDYGAHLSTQFQYRVEPPFDDVYADHAMYLRALLGERVDRTIAHFRQKILDNDPAVTGTAPAQVLVALLVRLKRHREAIEISREHLSEVTPEQLACPSVLQLCQMAGDSGLLRKVARERGDLLGFTAGLIV